MLWLAAAASQATANEVSQCASIAESVRDVSLTNAKEDSKFASMPKNAKNANLRTAGEVLPNV